MKNQTIGNIASARGCNYGCTFCPHHYGGKVRQQSPGRTAAELKSLEHFLVHDTANDFLINPSWFDQFIAAAEELNVSKNLYIQSNARSISLYPEAIKKIRTISNNLTAFICADFIEEKYLKKYNRDSSIQVIEKTIQVAKEYEMDLCMNFMVDPDFSEEEFRRLEDFVVDHPTINKPQFGVLTPYPNTPYYTMRAHEIINKDWRYYDGFHAVVPTKLNPEKFRENFDSLWNIANAHLTHHATTRFKAKEIDFDDMEKYLDQQ